MDGDTSTAPITTSFTTLSAIFSNIDAPPPWQSERTRFQNWGTSAGLTGSPNPLFSNPEVRKGVLVALYRLEADFTDESAVVTRCGLMHKKGGVGGAFKKGFKKLTGKSSSHLPPAAGNVDPAQKWVVQFPEMWASKLGDVTNEINLLSKLVPPDSVGAVTQGMGGMAISNQRAPAPPPTPAATTAEPSEAEQERMYNELEKLEEVINAKDEGVIKIILSPSTNYSSRVKASVYHDDESVSRIWHDEAMGYVKMGHGSFELYHRRRYMKPSTSKYSTDTDEDYVLFDVESNPKYEHIVPGTCTIDGFGMEAWDYELAFGRPRDNTVLVSYASLPDVSARQLIRRIAELQNAVGSKFGWTPKKDRHDLEEFYGNMGHA
ncbi:hypothetical protein TWF281_006338 [Arthrobotrys megalospora]